MGKKNNKETVSVKVNGNLIENETEIADVLNKYYVTVAEQLIDDSCQPVGRPATGVYSSASTMHSMYLVPVTHYEIRKIVLELKSRRAPGYDNVSSDILKSIIEYIINELVY